MFFCNYKKNHACLLEQLASIQSDSFYIYNLLNKTRFSQVLIISLFNT